MKSKINGFIEGSDIDPKVWKRIVWIFLSILILIFVIVLSFEWSKGNCANFYDSIEEEYQGKVIDKYLNPQDHMHATIKLDNGKSYVVNPFDTTSYFETIEIGDQVLKHKQSLKYFVIKEKDTLMFEIREPDCNEYLSN